MKLLFIAHGFQSTKTGSTVFFQRILQENFEVDFEINSSSLDIKKINSENYQAIVFFQISPFKYLTQLKCKNLIFVPMYDSTNMNSYRYKQYVKYFKVIDFSKTLYNFHIKNNVESFYIQFYPEFHQETQNLEKDIFFFWQRRNEISWKQIKKIIGPTLPEGISKVHLHNAPDPNTTFTAPSEDDIKTYNISISTWFENKNDLIELLKKSRYYVAPRLAEGIGFSFLDAMYYGNVIISHDAPTMNEYIVNNESGHLVDMNNCQQICFDNYEIIKKTAINKCIDGRKTYETTIPLLIEFIKNQPQSKKINFFDFIIFKTEHLIRKILKK